MQLERLLFFPLFVAKNHPLPPCHVASESIWRGWWLQLCGKVIHRYVTVSLGTVLVRGGVSGGVV